MKDLISINKQDPSPAKKAGFGRTESCELSITLYYIAFSEKIIPRNDTVRMPFRALRQAQDKLSRESAWAFISINLMTLIQLYN